MAKLKVFVLDDSQHRLDIFAKKLKKHDVDLVKTSKQAISKLKKNKYDFIFLDHDLGGKQMVWDEDNCGMQVVDYIIKSKKHKESIIYIHSYNAPRAKEMTKRLKDNKYHATYLPGAWENIED